MGTRTIFGVCVRCSYPIPRLGLCGGLVHSAFIAVGFVCLALFVASLFFVAFYAYRWYRHRTPRKLGGEMARFRTPQYILVGGLHDKPLLASDNDNSDSEDAENPPVVLNLVEKH
jgi:hypothetical protein